MIPGFPAHPDHGFERVTVVQRGMMGHSYSKEAASWYVGGNVEWLTAESGV